MGNAGDDRFYEILADEQFIPFFDEFRDTSYYFVDSFESYMNYFIRTFRSYADSLQRRTYLMYGLFTVLTTFAGLTFSLATARGIIGKIKLVGESFSRVSRGDFSQGMPVRGHDEFTDLAMRFNALSLDLKENVDAILRLSRSVGRSIAIDSSMENVLRTFVNSVVQETHAATALIHFLGTAPGIPGKTVLKLRSAQGELTMIPPEVLRPIIDSVLNLGEPVVMTAEQVRQCNPDLVSLMVLPLMIDKTPMGTLSVALGRGSAELTDLGIIRLSTFAEFASLTLANHFTYAELIR